MKNKSTTYLLIVTLLIAIVLSMAHPVTPVLIRTLELPSIMFGVFFASMSLGNFFFSPIWGGLSDSKGRIKFMILGLLGYGISQLGFGYVSNTILIVIFRIMGGAFVTSYLTVSLAYLTDITTKENRIKYMSYYAAAGTMGSALGSLLGGIIGNNNYKLTFLCQFILSLILSVAMFIALKEPIRENVGKAKLKIRIGLFKQYKNILNKNLILVMGMVIIFYFAGTSYNSTINYYIESILKLPPTFNGAFLAVAGIIGFLSNILLTPYIGKRCDEGVSFKVITLMLAISIGVASIVPNTVMFFIFIIIFVAISSIYVPVQQNIVTKLAKENYGIIMGVQNSAKAVGMVIGSLFAGAVFDFGSKIPFYAAAIVLIIGYIILVSIKLTVEN